MDQVWKMIGHGYIVIGLAQAIWARSCPHEIEILLRLPKFEYKITSFSKDLS